MTIPQKDSKKMQRLAKEGKQITKINLEDFPEYSYWEIYSEVYGSGERGIQGVRNMITRRLDILASAKGQKKQDIIDEVNDLIWHLYNNHRANQRKLANIRKILSE